MPPERKADRFGRLLVSIGHSINRLEREQVCCGELTFQQFDTLRRIDRNETNTVSALSSALGIDESTASRNVGILVRDGYLTKDRNQSDARTYQLRLTAKAKRALSALSCDERDVFGAVFERLAPGDRQVSLAVLAALERTLRGDEAQPCCLVEPRDAVTGRGQRE